MSEGIKTVLLGESTIGKTSIVTRLVRDMFTENTNATIGASYSVGKDNKFKDFKFNFWDTAGQERFASIMPMYYRDSKLILLIFDMNRLESIDKMVYYLEKLKAEVHTSFEVIVIGNKMDLVSNVKDIDIIVREKLEEFHSLIGSTDYIYVSTKSGKNFDLLINKLIEKGTMIEHDKDDLFEDDGIINIADPPKKSYLSGCGYCV